jgi:hypothetical protein
MEQMPGFPKPHILTICTSSLLPIGLPSDYKRQFDIVTSLSGCFSPMLPISRLVNGRYFRRICRYNWISSYDE